MGALSELQAAKGLSVDESVEFGTGAFFDGADLQTFQSRGSCFGPQSPPGSHGCQAEDYLEAFPASGRCALGQINEDEAFGVDVTPEPKPRPRSTTRTVPTHTCKTTYLCHQ